MQNNLTKFDCGTDAVAIIGISFRLPGGISRFDQLWQALLEKQCLVSEVPSYRFNTERFLHDRREVKGHSVTFKAGITGDIRMFDAAFFRMGMLEARALDPQQRLMLEMSYEAFESGGIVPSAFKGSDTAVFIGAASTDMAMSRADDPAVIGPYTMTGNNLSIISNRLSYFYDLHGPSMTVDTACSSSLTALHQACESLRSHACSAAIAGGVNILMSPLPFVGFSQAHMLSASGRCKVFAADADGYVRAEGGGVVILKRLADAVADGDKIFGIIEKTGVNQDGRTAGIALPSQTAQQNLLQSLYGGHDLSSLVYLEAHGTGTAAGDPIECKAAGHILGTALAKQQSRELYIGSIKSNVGHLETGSGMAGLVKALLMLQHRQIPGQLYADNLNPEIDFAGLNLKVSGSTVDFPEVDEPALIGLNSFGFGGSNAHAVLRRYEPDFVADKMKEQGRKAIPSSLSLSLSGGLNHSAEHQPAADKETITADLIGLNSFGFGGSNAHAVLRRYEPDFVADKMKEQGRKAIPSSLSLSLSGGLNHSAEHQLAADKETITADPADKSQLLLISAATYGALHKLASSYASLLEQQKSFSLSEICSAAFHAREHLPRRLIIQADSKNSFIQALRNFARNNASDSVQETCDAYRLTECQQAPAGKLALVFSGNGSQYPGMGYDLYRKLPEFAACFDEIAAELSKLQHIDFKHLIQSRPEVLQALEIDFASPAVAQPFIFAIELALGKVLLAQGFAPAACCGHSVGEVAAACLSGRLSLQEACLVIVRRSYHQARTSRNGAMAAVRLSASVLQSLLQQLSASCPSVEIAADNAPDSYTLSGLKQELAVFGQAVTEHGGVFRLLKLDYAFHSSLMGPVEQELRRDLSGIKSGRGSIDFYSALDGRKATDRALDADYWWHNIRDRVEFKTLISALLADGFVQFIEVGPRAILTSYIRHIAAQADKMIVADSLLPSRITKDESSQLSLSVLRCMAGGLCSRLQQHFLPYARSAGIDLPAYPFERELCWSDSTSESFAQFNPSMAGTLAGSKLPFSQAFLNEIDASKMPFFCGHKVHGQVILPFAAFLLALKQACEYASVSTTGPSCRRIVNAELFASVNLSGNLKRQLIEQDSNGALSFSVRDFAAPAFSLAGKARSMPYAGSTESADLTALQARLVPCAADDLYARALSAGIDYQDEFRRVKQVMTGDKEVLALLDMHPEAKGMPCSVAGLDGALQLMFLLQDKLAAGANRKAHSLRTDLFLPSSAAEFALQPFAGTQLYAHFRLVRATQSALTADIDFYTPDGRKTGYISGCRYRKVQVADSERGLFYREFWQQTADITAAPSACASAFASCLKTELKAAGSGQDDATALFNAALCALTGRLIAELRQGDLSVPVADMPSLSAEEVFGCILDSQVLPLAELLLTHCCDFGYGRQQDNLFSIDIAGLVSLDYDVLIQTLLEKCPESCAYAELLALLELNFRSLVKDGSCNLKIADYVQTRCFSFDHSALALREALHRAFRQILPVCRKQQQVLSVLEICTEPSALVLPAAAGGKQSLSALSLVRLAVSAGIKAALGTQSGELSTENCLAQVLMLDVNELKTAVLQAGLRFDVIIVSGLLHTCTDSTSLHELESILPVALRAEGLLLAAERNDNTLDALVYMLRQIAVQSGNTSSSVFGDAIAPAAINSHGSSFYQHIVSAGMSGTGQSQAAELDIKFFVRASAGSDLAIQSEASAPAARQEQNYALYLAFGNTDAAENARSLISALSAYDVRILPAGDGKQTVSASAVFAAAGHKKDWRQYVHCVLQTMAGARTEPQEVACNVSLGFGLLILDARTAATDELAQILYDVKQAVIKAEQLGFDRICLLLNGDFEAAKAADYIAASHALCAGDKHVCACALRALMRTAVNELPLHAASIKTIFCASDTSADFLGAELASGSQILPQKEVLLSHNRRYINELDCLPEAAADNRLQNANQKQPYDNRMLTFRRAGRLSSLYLKPQALPEPSAEEVLIEVSATGLNFRDVLWASGMLPDEALENGFAGASLGLECSGIVRAAGSLVSSVAPGDRVMAFGSACFSDFILTKANAVMKIPADFSFAAAASLPVIFFTAYYSVVVKAQAAAKESILIHGAAGGVGLAALQIAKDLGLTVFATAGSEVKRSLLKSLGADYVFSSRSLSFADEIMAVTAGQGVDIVLNSLYSEAAALSLSVLRPCGRFIELGKRDFYADHSMFLKAFKDNLTYCGVDADELLNLQPAMCAGIMHKLAEAFAAGKYRPVAFNLYPESAAARAFYDLRAASGIGKLVVVKEQDLSTATQADLPQSAVCYSDKQAVMTDDGAVLPARSALKDTASGYVIVSGGLGGLGQAVVRKLYAGGQRHFVLIGRRSAARAKDELARLRNSLQHLHQSSGTAECKLLYLSADLADKDALAVAFSSLPPELPVSLICHAAGELHDAPLIAIDATGFEAELAVKLRGALNLIAVCRQHNASAPQAGQAKMRCVFFSSVAALLGNPGQGNYAAANAAVEGLAEVLTQEGVPSLSIGWGPVADAGMLAGKTRLAEALERRLGTGLLHTDEICAALEIALTEGLAGSVWFFRCNWQRIASMVYMQSRLLPVAARFELHPEDTEDEDLAEKLRALSGRELEQALSALIIKEAAALLGVPAADLSGQTDLASLGMDSLTLMELTVRLSDLLKINFGPEHFAACRTLNAFARTVARLMSGDDAEQQLLSAMQEQHGVRMSADAAIRVTGL